MDNGQQYVPCDAARTPLLCKAQVVPGGKEGTGLCTSCWHSRDEIQRYRDMREEGYTQYEAAVRSGLADPEE